MKSNFLIGATASGCGKTTFTIGLLRALKKRGLIVQPFKCGPDYIDTQFHTLASGNVSVNLDRWFSSEEHIHSIYDRYVQGADVAVTEGVMGLFDGYSKMEGSSAQLAQILDLPIILLVNARSTAYSVSPIIYGFSRFRPDVRIAGVIFNQVASESHFSHLREACADVHIPCLGYLPKMKELEIPSRHLGLTLSAEIRMEQFAETASEYIEKYVDIDRLLDFGSKKESSFIPKENIKKSDKVIAIARDEAFNFTYRENIDRLSNLGKLVFFSPLHGDCLPEADLLYLPGGYPELFAYRLSRRKKLMSEIKSYTENGGRILAECGGMMFLGRSLVSSQGKIYPMVGALPFDFTMKGARLHLGYRKFHYKGQEWRGHEFHYSEIIAPDILPSVASQYASDGKEVATSLYRYKNIIASYTHLYWGTNDFLSLW